MKTLVFKTLLANYNYLYFVNNNKTLCKDGKELLDLHSYDHEERKDSFPWVPLFWWQE